MLLLGVCLPIMCSDRPISVDQQPAAPYAAQQTLEQKASLYLIKKLVSDKQFACQVAESALPDVVKDLIPLADLLQCLITLSQDPEYSNQNILQLALSEDFFDSFQEELDDLDTKIKKADSGDQLSEYENQKKFLNEQLDSFRCIATHFNIIVGNSRLVTLLLYMLNESEIHVPSVQRKFFEDARNSIIEWLIIKHYDYVIERLIQEPFLKILLLKYAVDLYTDHNLIDSVLNTYDQDLTYEDLQARVHNALRVILESLTQEELLANKAELTENIVERLVLLTSLDAGTKQLLSILFQKGVSAQITVFYDENNPPIPLAAVLFAVPLDQVVKKMGDIGYLVENGLDLSSVQIVTTTNNQIIALAQQHYQQLKQSQPHVISLLESLHTEYQQKTQRMAQKHEEKKD